MGRSLAPFARILVAVDGDDHTREVARVAATVARAVGGQLTLLHVYDAPSAVLGEPNYSTALSQALEAAKQVVDAARQAVTTAGGPAPETEWLGGPPAETIVAAARDGGYGLVVVGTRRRGRLEAALLGSVSSAVAARAGCPVLVVGGPT